MIKFFGPPLKEIKSKNTGKVLFVFDTKGEFVTDDPIIIERAMGFFDYVGVSAEVEGERVAKTYTVPPIVITEKGQEEEKTGKVCAYCNEIHEKPVDYAHCAKKHKKEG